jgi:hypothetical protein
VLRNAKNSQSALLIFIAAKGFGAANCPVRIGSFVRTGATPSENFTMLMEHDHQIPNANKRDERWGGRIGSTPKRSTIILRRNLPRPLGKSEDRHVVPVVAVVHLVDLHSHTPHHFRGMMLGVTKSAQPTNKTERPKFTRNATRTYRYQQATMASRYVFS